MDLSIIILNYNTRGLLKECIKGLKLANPLLDYEVIIVDNASSDGSQEYMKELAAEWDRIRIILNPKNVGFAAGNNIGVKASRGEYALIVNSDITFLPGAIEALVKFLDENAEVGIVGPKILSPTGLWQSSCFRFPQWFIPFCRRTILGKTAWGKRALKKYLMADFDREITKEVDWLLGACFLARRGLFLRLGLFDERFFLFFEDTDLCRRIWDAGFKVVFLPEAKVIHLEERLSADHTGIFHSLLNKNIRIHIRSAVRYFWKYSLTRQVFYGKKKAS